MKKIYLLPSLFTLGNIFFGFLSIVSSIDDQFVQAAIVIIVAGFFDMFDGKIARATNSTSRFGVEFDSLADLVSFGVAPGVLVYLWAFKPFGFGRIGWLGAFLFLVGGALRLARFNVQVDTVSSERFVGLPIPAAAGMVATSVIFVEHYRDVIGPKERYDILILLLVYLLGILMVSNIKFRSAKHITLKGKSPYKIMVSVSFMLIIIALKPELVLFLIGVGYILLGLLEAIPGFSRFVFSWLSKHRLHIADDGEEDGLEEEEVEL